MDQFFATRFCPQCHNMYFPPRPSDTFMMCGLCGFKKPIREIAAEQVVTAVNVAPTGMRAEALRRKGIDKDAQKARIDEPCPECNAPQMLFHTAQLRSADEGQTIFYHCTECDHKFAVNS
ncbi:uncharacterized protein AMSG_08236 [Thecamonas trahens ATCC 50062]|uniref:DNA-directed RNA polymerase subunit n=1 Tax=Thecamonas trahens ATCC 50062 TaxID=461836 RepID=A0A0L0DIP9_THETB|nr:hypothetical protein AMSG_08236 [Thecamonas trahens ATCC 50062]KNC51986.1 hypothetical protein AMSG_08236 [Thecamonas trahens ATCC 50062]|eukprot:XP_013755572.1 hypothetical protein AMSG_08236 [Thecamonas trahens ATCC 50062]